MVGGGDNAATSPLMSLCAGGIAGGVEAACTYPFEFAKTRVQLYGHDKRAGHTTRNPFAIVATVAREEGARALYKGCSTMIVGSVGKDAVRFLAFDSIRAVFEDPETKTLGPGRSILSGMVAGVVASTLVVTPSERIKTVLIDDAKTSRRFKGAVDCIVTLTKEQGLLGALWRGYTTTTLKQVGTTGFRLGSYSTIKDWERKKGINVDTPVVSFANGAVAGTVTTLATQPFDTIKTMAQQAKQVSTMEVLREMLAQEGVKGLWRGTVMRLGRTVLAGGILFTANEQALKMLKLLTGK
ncbi:mitochondrial carrier domain-containing protein [Microdochium trichocladiopsis]|uniref:Mitochondrial carrier domain-containing protein n=1 Tax=Microdochium trichocladiopsis TaxID=1682393 RepID=A0A9P8Y865_9PEZI|nr:mitochondrial carrier domain-containing protein [Microdochium trichocladiopsis]KAH7032959.1 mitochondrial carrier domain-containing protein [Microdochium trichocladiopsis]